VKELKEFCENVLRDSDSDFCKVLAAIQAKKLATIVLVLSGFLEELRLGHEHNQGLKNIRPMGDGYGWCDYCQTKVNYGPGLAEEALKKANDIAIGV
jgi:hypothetical protein